MNVGRIGRNDGFSLAEALIAVSVVSGIIVATTQLLATSKTNFKLAELRTAISEDHLDLQTLLMNRDACMNTFGSTVIAANVAGATPAAPINVPNIRDGAAPPGNVLHNPLLPARNYFPRIPTNDALGQGNAKYRLVQISIVQGNTTGVNIVYPAGNVTVPNNSFAAAFTYRLTDNVGRSLGNATGNRDFYRFAIFRAQFNGAGRVLNCNSALADEFDLLFVNMKKDDQKTSPLEIQGRVHVFEIPGNENFSGYVHAQNYFVSSDRDLKENILLKRDSLAQVLRLRGVHFQWKDSGASDSGVVAQEVEPTLPEMVNQGDDSFKRVNYNHLIALTTDALREQSQRNSQLKSQIADLERRIQILREVKNADQK